MPLPSTACVAGTRLAALLLPASRRHLRTLATLAEHATIAAALPVRARRAPIAKGRVTPRLTVPPGILAPPYAESGSVSPGFPPPQIHDSNGVRLMRAAGAVAADVLTFAGSLVVPGITTDEIDRLVHDYCVRVHKVYPSPLNYCGFPKSVCTSVNEVVCHGIPDLDTVLEAGDLVKLDVSTFVDGYHGDTCRTFIAGGAGAIDARGAELASVTKECLDSAIAICGPGTPVARIGSLIHGILDQHGFTAVSAFAGHGVGTVFHCEPLVWHMRNSSRAILQEGQTFTIEPMVAEGQPEVVVWSDGWTAVTADGLRCAQYEHTLLVTAHGVDVLTKYE